jgi:hypothetical protein
MDTIIYVYATDRDDGLAYAVGIAPDEGPANGSLALFADAADAHLFAHAKQGKDGCTVLVLPSAEMT